MRGLTRRWVFRQDGGPRGEAEGGTLIERLLGVRGLRDPDAVRRFCEPRLSDLHDPSLLPGADAAAGVLVDAVRRGRRIVIYGDYDVDGVTAAAILFHVIKAVAPGCALSTYVPHRLDEGYGINVEALRSLRGGGAELVVSVDCGITAIEPALEARRMGLDLIITDHHNPAGMNAPVPAALAVVHPRLTGSAYPFGELCGAGVAFKLAWRFATLWCGSPRVTGPLRQLLLDLLSLAALGTIADVVPLVGENRTIATHGLAGIRQTPFAGLGALIDAADLGGQAIDAETVGFRLAPLLNACGRMGHAADAVKLLTEASPLEAAAIAAQLVAMNRSRQQTERSILLDAARRAEEAGMTADDRRAIVLADERWHAGVLGIVCSRLVERYGRPAILLQRTNGECRGSGRSAGGYPLYDGLAACAALLQQFGGHDAAAGLVVRAENLDAFADAFIAHANGAIGVADLTPAVTIDCDARLDELDHGCVERIGRLAPFGRDNPRPAVRVEAVTVAAPPRAIGSNGRHLAIQLRSGEGTQRRLLRSVWFGGGEHAAQLAAGMTLDMVIEPKLNTFNGATSVEGEIRDVRVR